MAITKIHAIKATVSKAITYICNPHKTDDGILISYFGCSPESAPYDFRNAISRTKQHDSNQAFHLIQSFAPGEVSFDEAHKVGAELANRLLEGKYSYVLTTHIDRGHVHNHIIFCAADNIEHKKYHDCKQTYRRIRDLSDKLCQEHNLSVIIPEGHGMKYNEWQASRNQSVWKQKLRADIDDAILNTESYEDCIEMIRAKGYEVSGESLEPDAHKYITFRPLDRERPIRGSEKSLGADYTKERIKARIEERIAQREKAKETPTRPAAPIVRQAKNLTKDYSKGKLIDTTQEKFVNSPGLDHWAKIQNLKVAAASYAESDSMRELSARIEAKRQLAKTARETLVNTEHQMTELGEILKYAEDYAENKKYHFHYSKAKDQDAYLRRRETELRLYDGAVHMLKCFGINPKTMNLEQMKADYYALEAKKNEMQKAYKSAEKDARLLQQKYDNIQQFLGQEQNRAEQQSSRNKNEQSL